MENNDDLRLLIKIAQMYYEQDLTQSQIAKSLGIYRTTISRMLKKIRQQGIVTIAINYQFNETLLLEQRLKQRFGLKEAIVSPVDAGQSMQEQLNSMGLLCANFLNGIIEDRDVIGFSWGSALAAVVDQMADGCGKKTVTCVPMVGGPSGKLESRYHVNTIVYSAASKMRAESKLIDFPAILEQKLIRDGIMESQHYRAISEYWDKLDIAVFGIGSPNITGHSIWRAFYGSDVIEHVNTALVAGDICSRFYDSDGKGITTYLSEKTINITLDKIKRANYAIGVAHSYEKLSGIIGAINGGYINCLVTTKETAEKLLTITP
ncbi:MULTISPECIES: sugar-binding transcriptional regulator [unclassified Brenneria]|uniref:sugar-binding transcriptional regulator n=1 Tax=unclassified Brenneria TaxID=2634434 RepID=UPI0029C3387C|nr:MULTISPECIES: sugar-binding transcriptional regulator [unclassified Brenneria]MDX5628946.1 sugar-binding transcriptional regulator [Brenneria sp. L3-3Z]MDX5696085.1 sugar-binding transcriptional regulator [Brenneria sp. L4-2C]MEE3661066.1 sugar-binding transcriptional regulator [Brenneria sp. g21c3]